MNLKHAFTKRELIFILIGAILLGAVCYWRFVYIPIQDQIASYDIEGIETQIQQEQTKAQQIKEMQQAIKSSEKISTGKIATYDNLTNEINVLNRIVSDTTSYHFDFEDPYMQDTTVRRNITLTFTAKSLKTAEKVVSSLYSCKYRLLIGDLTIENTESSSNVQSGPVSATIDLTFLETTVGAKSLDGLLIMDSDGNLMTQEEYAAKQESGTDSSSSSTDSSSSASGSSAGSDSSTE